MLYLDFPIKFQSHGLSELASIISQVIFGLQDNNRQSHGLSKLSLIIFHVILELRDKQFQFHGLFTPLKLSDEHF